jgi:hypothetical protein
MNPSNHSSAETCPSGMMVQTPPRSIISIQMPELTTPQLCSGSTEPCVGRESGFTASISRNVGPDTEECSTLEADSTPGQHDDEKDAAHEEYLEDDAERSENLMMNIEALPPSNLVTVAEAHQPQSPATSFVDNSGDIQIAAYLPDQVRREAFSFNVGKYTITTHTRPIARSDLNNPRSRGWQIRMFIYLIMMATLVNFLVLWAQRMYRYMS